VARAPFRATSEIVNSFRLFMLLIINPLAGYARIFLGPEEKGEFGNIIAFLTSVCNIV
jgi:hypothetical protein